MKIMLGMSNLSKVPLQAEARSKGARLTAAMLRRAEQKEEPSRQDATAAALTRALRATRTKLHKLAFTLRSPAREDQLARAKSAAASRAWTLRK